MTINIADTAAVTLRRGKSRGWQGQSLYDIKKTRKRIKNFWALLIQKRGYEALIINVPIFDCSFL